MKKGILLSMDALVAVGLLLFMSLLLAGVSLTYHSPEAEYQRLYYQGRDQLNVLGEVKMSGLRDFQIVRDYEQEGLLTAGDMDKSFIDAIGSLWATGNVSAAANLTEAVLGGMMNNSRFGYSVLMDGNDIYTRNSSGEIKHMARLTAVLSGYSVGRPVEGYVSKAYLTTAKKSSFSYTYFGGYEGEGNITKAVTLPDDAEATGAYMELDAGANFSLYINGNFSGSYNVSGSTGGFMRAESWTLTSQQAALFHAGQNTITLNFSDIEKAHVGGGFIRVGYTTTDFITETYGSSSERYWFPGINGIPNLFSSFSVPGDLRNLTVYLHYRNNITLNNTGVPVYFVIGSTELYRSNRTGEISATLDSSTLSQNLSFSFLSNKTVPIRFGTEEFFSQSGIGKSDSVLITDNSGSMSTCDVSATCSAGLCDASAPCNNLRSNVARMADTEFVDTILNVSGNRVGAVAYGTSVCRFMNLSSNRTALYAEIAQYGSGCSSTCTSCGVRKATDDMVNMSMVENVIAAKSSWSYNVSFPSSEPGDDVNGSHWIWTNYTESWPSGNGILGFENTAYSPNVNTNIGNNGGNYYFRKNFNISYPVDFADLNLLYDDAAEVWLNGRLVYNSTGVASGSYWNTQSVIFFDGFETYYPDGVNKIDSATQLNVSPGYWIAYNVGEETYVMSNQSTYPAHNGTDVLVFRDMDTFGSMQTVINLSGYSHPVLSYWWNMSGLCDTNSDYANITVNDGTGWYSVETNMPNAGDDDNMYHKKTFDLSYYNRAENFTIKFGAETDDDDERFYVDDVLVQETAFRIDRNYFVQGENSITVKLRNADAGSAKFDAELNVTQSRYKAMLIMSDGDANMCFPGFSCGDAQSKGELRDKACQAWNKYGIHIYTVAFGNAGAGAISSLNKTACCESCSHFYTGNDTAGLKKIYRDIAEEIANASLVAQVFNVSGNTSLYRNALYPDSYIEYNFTPAVRPFRYGEISLNLESQPFSNASGPLLVSDNNTGTKEGWFYVQNGTEVVDAKVTSYSSEYWTDRVYLRNKTTGTTWKRVYWLSDFGGSGYSRMGDPYFVSMPVAEIMENNSVKIGSSLSNTTNASGGSPESRVLYTIRVGGIALEGYSGVFPKASGSTNRIYYDTDGNSVQDGYVDVQVGQKPSDAFDPENDSVDDAFMRLMDRMNFLLDLNESSYGSGTPANPYDGIDSSNPIDLQISSDINIASSSVGGVPSMWGPVGFEIRVWY